MMKKLKILAILIASVKITSTALVAYPFVMPEEKPDIPLSKAMNRVYDQYKSTMPQTNELYSRFFYTDLKGLEYSNNGTITRRDPSKIVKVDEFYYVWYTKRDTPSRPMGAAKATDTIPSSDWDLSDIWYARSKDGFTWEEMGVAVPRPSKPNLGWRSVSTPDILVWKGKYYLYYQAFSEISGKRGDDCPVAVSYSDSPNGPWTPANKEIIPNGKLGEWDCYSIHDPHPIVYKGKIYLYYKSDYNGQPLIRSTGLAIAQDPLGPFKKCELNPVLNSGHETFLFRFKTGIAAIMSRDGHEFNTIQYAPDGVNFDVVANVFIAPDAGGVYDPDAFNDVEQAQGITWGLSHYCIWGENHHTKMLRFDCDLSTKIDDKSMKNTSWRPSLDELLKKNGLSKAQKDSRQIN